MRHVRSTVFVALVAMGTATTAMPLDAWAKKGKKGAKKNAGKAQAKAQKKAARMEKAGKKAYVKGKYDDALIAFEAAYEAHPQPKHLYNMARCHEQKGNLAKAAEYYEQYLREAPDAEDRDDVETRAELLTKKLKKTMGRLEIVSTPTGAVVQVKGETASTSVKTPWSGWLEPGAYDLSAVLDGHNEQKRKVAFTAGDQKKVALKMAPESGKKAEPEPPAASPPEVSVATTEKGELLLSGIPEGAAVTLDGEPLEDAGAGPLATTVGTHRVGISLGSRPPVTVEAVVKPNDTVTLDLGAVLLATFPAAGAVFGVLASQAEDDEVAAVKAAEEPGAPSMIDEINGHHEAARRNVLVANISFGVGAVGVVAGVLLLLMGSDGSGETVWAPMLAPGAVGVAGRF